MSTTWQKKKKLSVLIHDQFRTKLTFLALNSYSFTVCFRRTYFSYKKLLLIILLHPVFSWSLPCYSLYVTFSITLISFFFFSSILLIFGYLQLISHLFYPFCQFLLPPCICLIFVITVYLFLIFHSIASQYQILMLQNFPSYKDQQ